MEKRKIEGLKGALAYKVNQLYQAEKQMKKMLPECSKQVDSARLASLLSRYAQAADDKLLKLERAFNYLMEEPSGKTNKVVEKMNDETHELMSMTEGPVRDAVLVACQHTAIQYKIAGYSVARTFALELEMEVVALLLGQILEWETTADQELQQLAVNHVNVRAMQGTVS